MSTPKPKFSHDLPLQDEYDSIEVSVRKNDSDNLISFRERAGEDRFMVEKGNMKSEI